jgi:hypothetical protein
MVISLYTHLTPSANSLPDLFQSDHDFDLVSDLNHKAVLTTLERQAQTTALAAGKEGQDVDCIYYTIYGGSCSDPVWIRQHRDSGVLNTLIAEKETKMITTPTTDQELEFHLRDPCYVYVLLGACAMTLGCQLPDLYIAMLKKVYTEGGLMPDAPKQIKKALFGPDGYTNGTPYDLESKDLLQIANYMNHKDQQPNRMGVFGMNVMGPAASSTPTWAVLSRQRSSGSSAGSTTALIPARAAMPNRSQMARAC